MSSIPNPTLAAAFLVGLLGSAHCIGMCGGIVGALTMGLPASIRGRWAGMLPYLLLYNAGRLASYTVAGLLAGAIGHQAAQVAWRPDFPVGGIVAGLFMIALGLYLAGWSQALVVFEQWGGNLWRRLEPLGRGLLPVRNPLHALALGLLWGWLPCGMVYAALAWSLTTADPLRGAALMLSFGAGTLPTLFVMGSAARGLTWVVQRPIVRQLAGITVILFGIITVAKPLLADKSHQHHQHHSARVIATPV